MLNITLKKLKWLAILAPALFIGAFEFVRHTLFYQINNIWFNLVTILLVAGAAYVFSDFVFGIIGRLQKNVEERNNELVAINKIALGLGRSLNQDEILSTATQDLYNSFHDTGIALYILHENKLHLLEKKGQLKDWAPNFIDLTGAPLKKASYGLAEAVRKGSSLVEQVSSTEHLAYLPFKGRKGVLGIIFMARNRSFSSRELQTLNIISNQLGFSIENARLHSQVYEMATLEERERIAREVHDGLAQILGYVTLKASIAQRHLSARQISQAESDIKDIEKVTQEAYVDARETILGLRTYISKEGGLVKTLNEYISRFKLTSGIKAELETKDGQDLKFSSSEEIQLIRIIQEALTNIRKHAKARKAWIRFRTCDDSVQLIIEDDGQGFDISSIEGLNKTRYGLQTMKERTEKIGASFRITSFLGLGTKIEVNLPIRNKAGVELETYESASR